MMKKAGAEGVQTVFLFSDQQIKDEAYVEDINMILNTADIPNLFPADEKAELIEKMQVQLCVLCTECFGAIRSQLICATAPVVENLHFEASPGYSKNLQNGTCYFLFDGAAGTSESRSQQHVNAICVSYYYMKTFTICT